MIDAATHTPRFQGTVCLSVTLPAGSNICRPALALHVVEWKIIDHPSEAEVVQLERKFFVRHGEMGDTQRMR